MSRRHVLSALGALLLALAVAWSAGFLWFTRVVARPMPPPPHADGIVALTGGAARVETALRLLARGRGDRLLLSGIGGGAELGELAYRAGLDPAPLAPRVTLGRTATSTRGNATETRGWVRSNQIHSLIVVTAFYHMPRALTELRRALPGVVLYPFPVLNADLPGPNGEGHLVTLRLLAEEYTKYLVAQTGLSTWLPGREPPSHGHPA